MKSMVLMEYRKLELKDMPTPALGPGDVQVRVGACGVY